MSRRDDPLTDLVRQHLEREEARVDAPAVLARVRGRLTNPKRPSVAGKLARWGAGFVGIAAALMLVLWGMPSSVASAESLLMDAQKLHGGPQDRLYLIETQNESSWTKRFPVLAFQRKAQLWTRGDRFFIETSGENHRWAWGKDENSRLWLSLNPKTGLIFNSDEIDDVMFATELYSMKLETLLGELPKGYDLKRESIPEKPGFVRISALPKKSLVAPRLREASLEMDLNTKEVHKLVLKRWLRGETLVVTTYTLSETRQLPDTDYQLQGHLDPDVKPLGPDRAPLRDVIWKRVLEKRGLAPKVTP